MHLESPWDFHTLVNTSKTENYDRRPRPIKYGFGMNNGTFLYDILASNPGNLTGITKLSNLSSHFEVST